MDYFLLDTLKLIHELFRVSRNDNRVKLHTTKLEYLGDLSFPANLLYLLDLENDPKPPLELHESKNKHGHILNTLKTNSEKWNLKLSDVKLHTERVCGFFERPIAFKYGIEQCMHLNELYGSLHRKVELKISVHTEGNENDSENTDLTHLRMIILQKVVENLSKFQNFTENTENEICLVITTRNSGVNRILCGAVVDENGVKNSKILSKELYNNRSTNMRLIAEHKYGLRIKSSQSWKEYFEKLGSAAVIIEMLQNKPNKNIKIVLNDLSSPNKGPAFICYNCARISALLKEFEKKVREGVYSSLPAIEEINFSLLKEPEEWELFYVYILQYPNLIESCIHKELDDGISVKPNYLVTFLSSLCSTFSCYYRKSRILVTSKPHLIPTIHARIYLLTALEIVFCNTLRLLNIEPIREM